MRMIRIGSAAAVLVAAALVVTACGTTRPTVIVGEPGLSPLPSPVPTLVPTLVPSPASAPQRSVPRPTVTAPRPTSALSRPTAAARATRYPATLTLRPGARPAGEGPWGRAIAAFVHCGDPTTTVGSSPDSGCAVVLDRPDGSQVTIPAPIATTPVSLSPDGTWLVYLTPNATVLRNLLTGSALGLRSYLKPITWSANSRWFLAGLSDGGDAFVLDTATGAQTVHEHAPPPPGASSAPLEPMPSGPFYPAAVTDDGDVVRYPRPETAASGLFAIDVVAPATMKVRRTFSVRLDATAGAVTPRWQYPALLVLGDRAYLTSSWRGGPAVLPVALSGGQAQVGRPLSLTGPGPLPAGGNVLGDVESWQSVAALPGQGLVYRVPGSQGNDFVAIDPATGRSQLLAHSRATSVALAALAPS